MKYSALEAVAQKASYSDAAFRRRATPLKLVVFDLENTLVFNEFLPELARLVGKEREVADITRRGIDGEIDWEEGFRLRARVLAGLPQAQVLRAARHLRPVPGAQEFVHWLRSMGHKVVLLTGGPREVAESAMALFEADAAFCNEFRYEDGVFTGEVAIHVGPGTKADIVRRLAAKWSITREDILAFGDGIMDVPFLSEASVRLGINSNGKLRDHVHFEATDYEAARRWLLETGTIGPARPRND